MSYTKIAKKLIIKESIYKKILDDMIQFKYIKDGEKYKENEILTNIIINTYKYKCDDDYTKKISSIIERHIKKGDNTVANNINFKDKNILNDLLSLILEYSQSSDDIDEDKYVIKQIRSNKNNADDLCEILYDYASNNNASTVFKSLLYDYASYPRYVREKIIYYKLFKSIEIGSTYNISLKGRNKDDFKNNRYYIYDIINDFEENHNYVIELLDNNVKREIRCCRLSNIEEMCKVSNKIILTDQEKQLIENKLEAGPEWVGTPYLNECEVTFTDNGIKNFIQKYKNRPKNHKIDGNKVIFKDCSIKQLLIYLKYFGDEILYVSNQEIKDGLKQFYSDAKKHFDKL